MASKMRVAIALPCAHSTNKGNASSVELNADWCDTKYPINWFKTSPVFGEHGWVKITTEYFSGQNREKIGVNRLPTYDETYTVTCVREGTNYPCNFPFSVYSTEAYNFLNTKPDFPGTGQSGPTTSPEVCNEISLLEKSGNAPGRTGYLYSDFCPGHVQWFAGDGGSQGKMITDLSDGKRYRTSIVNAPQTYYYVCYYPKGKCEGSSTIEPEPNKPSGGRVAADESARIASTIIEEQCSNSISLALVMKEFYSKMLCQDVNIYTGDRIVAEKYLDQLLSLIPNNVSGTAIKSPSDKSGVIDKMYEGKCEDAVDLLVAPNIGIMVPVSDANDNVIRDFGSIKDNVIKETSKYKVSDLLSAYFFEAAA